MNAVRKRGGFAIESPAPLRSAGWPGRAVCSVSGGVARGPYGGVPPAVLRERRVWGLSRVCRAHRPFPCGGVGGSSLACPGGAGWLLARLLPPRRWCGRVFGSFLFRGRAVVAPVCVAFGFVPRPLFEYFLRRGCPPLAGSLRPVWRVCSSFCFPRAHMDGSGCSWGGWLVVVGAAGGAAGVGGGGSWARGAAGRSGRPSLGWASRTAGVRFCSFWAGSAAVRLSHRREAALRPRRPRGLFACVVARPFFWYTECEPRLSGNQSAPLASKARSKPEPCKGLFSRS